MRLRIGIVGCGEAAQVLHLPALDQLADRFSVEAVCDIDETVRREVAREWGVPHHFADYREMMNVVDAILVANPNPFHSDVALVAIRAGKHVLVEKPLCMNLAECDAIIAAKNEFGVVVQVGTMRRYSPALIEACRLVKEMPEVRMARVHDLLGGNHLVVGPTSRVIRGSNASGDELERSKLAGIEGAIGKVPAAIANAYDLLLGLGSHDISAMRDMFGVPHRVLFAAERCNGLYLSAAFDYGSFVCQFETGIDSIARFDCFIEACGPERVVRVDFETPYVRNLPARLSITDADGLGVRRTEEHFGWGDAFTLEWQAFYDNVANGRNPKTSAEDFREDLAIFGLMIEAMK